MMSAAFTGFGDSFFQFFEDLKQNNNRDWFTAHKGRYKTEVVAPITAFITDMAPRLKEISTHVTADPRPNGGAMFRIYRDMRFSRDKKPYKEHAGVQFRHRLGRDAHAPGFYVHLEQDNLFFGGGIWQPPGPALFKIRDRIARHPEKWRQVLANPDLRRLIGGIGGEALTRPPRGFPADLEHLEDIKRKSFFAMRHEADHRIAASEDFLEEVTRTFNAARPLMVFIAEALDVPF